MSLGFFFLTFRSVPCLRLQKSLSLIRILFGVGQRQHDTLKHVDPLTQGHCPSYPTGTKPSAKFLWKPEIGDECLYLQGMANLTLYFTLRNNQDNRIMNYLSAYSYLSVVALGTRSKSRNVY